MGWPGPICQNAKEIGARRTAGMKAGAWRKSPAIKRSYHDMVITYRLEKCLKRLDTITPLTYALEDLQRIKKGDIFFYMYLLTQAGNKRTSTSDVLVMVWTRGKSWVEQTDTVLRISSRSWSSSSPPPSSPTFTFTCGNLFCFAWPLRRSAAVFMPELTSLFGARNQSELQERRLRDISKSFCWHMNVF